MAGSNAYVTYFAKIPDFFETLCWQPWKYSCCLIAGDITTVSYMFIYLNPQQMLAFVPEDFQMQISYCQYVTEICQYSFNNKIDVKLPNKIFSNIQLHIQGIRKFLRNVKKYLAHLYLETPTTFCLNKIYPFNQLKIEPSLVLLPESSVLFNFQKNG